MTHEYNLYTIECSEYKDSGIWISKTKMHKKTKVLSAHIQAFSTNEVHTVFFLTLESVHLRFKFYLQTVVNVRNT